MFTICCWNIRYFYTACNQLKNLIRKFDVFSLSEHGLFDEQKNLLESLPDEYKSKVVCSEDNPNFIAGRRGHGGVAIFWKQTLDDFVSPLDIVSDRIVGIQINAPNQDPLFILSIYFPLVITNSLNFVNALIYCGPYVTSMLIKAHSS